MAKIKRTIRGVAYYRDGGDGGGTTWTYNSMEDLREDHQWTDEEFQAIIDEEDPYENGEISETSVEVEVDTETLEVNFLGKMRTHWGQ